jgi:hypothetical protein
MSAGGCEPGPSYRSCGSLKVTKRSTGTHDGNWFLRRRQRTCAATEGKGYKSAVVTLAASVVVTAHPSGHGR